MAALQARIKELERHNAKTRRECNEMNLLIQSDEHSLNDREASLIAAADKAQQMLDGTSATLVELRRVRRENREFQSQLDTLQKQLNEKLTRQAESQDKLTRLTNRRVAAEKLLSEYEDLLCEILAPPVCDLNGAGSVPFNSTTQSVTTHSLPATLQTTVQVLQTLPYPFRDQKLEKKREVLAVLLQARDIAYKIANEIHELELEKRETGAQRRLEAEIEVKSRHLGLLIQAMSKFRFE
jgi:hypothetical protein